MSDTQFINPDLDQYTAPAKEMLRRFRDGGPDVLATWRQIIDETAEWRAKNILSFATIDVPADVAKLFGLAGGVSTVRLLDCLEALAEGRRF